MAGNGQIATDLLPYTATPTSLATGYLAPDDTRVTRPMRTFRSVGITTERIVFDLGAQQPFAGLYLHHTNAVQVTLEAAATSAGGPWVALNSVGGVYAIDQDVRTGRRKRFIADDDITLALNHRYLRLTFLGSPAEGYFYLGAVAIFASVVTLTRNPNAWDWTRVDPRTVTEYGSGGVEVNLEGPPYLLYRLDAAPWTTGDALDELVGILSVGPTAPIIVHENRGDRARAALCLRTDDVGAKEQFRFFESGFTLREAI